MPLLNRSWFYRYTVTYNIGVFWYRNYKAL